LEKPLRFKGNDQGFGGARRAWRKPGGSRKSEAGECRSVLRIWAIDGGTRLLTILAENRTAPAPCVKNWAVSRVTTGRLRQTGSL
jgi:hypothetical protein